MSKHVDDIILKSIDIPREKFIVEYMHESDKLKEKITLYEKIQYNNFNDDENRIDEFYKLK